MQSTVGRSLVRLDRWFESMRGHDGYFGPVTHWWQDCLYYTGKGLDWRYEGIVTAYLTLYRKTADSIWIERAKKAGNDLLRGQLPSSNFSSSCFERNPSVGGTPHEAACDIALLSLADELRKKNDASWSRYFESAKRNLWDYHIKLLWNERMGAFVDRPQDGTFVPNKAATVVEALLLYAGMTDKRREVEPYVRRTVSNILKLQIQDGKLQGAICQNSTANGSVPKFFPFYIARCIPALVAAGEQFAEEGWMKAARSALDFVLGVAYPDGSFPQVVYAGRRIGRYPQWVAGIGDILRAAHLLGDGENVFKSEMSVTWLLKQQQSDGSFPTAVGFAAATGQCERHRLPEFRDIIPVCGWNDKAFRYLAEIATPSDIVPPQASMGSDASQGQPSAAGEVTETRLCEFRGHPCLYESGSWGVRLRKDGRILYNWRKGSAWAEVWNPSVLGR